MNELILATTARVDFSLALYSLHPLHIVNDPRHAAEATTASVWHASTCAECFDHGSFARGDMT